MHIIILSGGVGSRLWPVSRDNHPKPFIKMDDGESILQKTLKRSITLPSVRSITSVSNGELLFKIKEEQQEVLNANPSVASHYILEPVGRNTAAAIALSAIHIANLYGEEAALLVLPSDHLINNQASFADAVTKAELLAKTGKIVTFGITTTRAETGYGYIEANGTTVKRFLEKPSLKDAEAYVSSGNFLWNAGMFCFTAGTMIKEMEKHCPDILSAVNEALSYSQTIAEPNGKTIKIDHKTFAAVRSDSIDYAVMEKSDAIAVIACDIGWSDIGNWVQMSELTYKDPNNNSIKGEAVLDDVHNCHIESDKRIIAAVGINDLIIIDTTDALLVASKNSAQDVKSIYNQLKKTNHETHRSHTMIHRPWGTYTVLSEGPGFKVKKIEVKLKASLSLQMHEHRSEHWVVISGIAKVINGDEEIILNVGESTYIPAKSKHRLTNYGDTKLVIIEVQNGSYVGEDDIIRFNDIYGRDVTPPYPS